MGLLTIIKKVKQKEREMRLLMVGLDNAGKTTIVKKFNGERIDTISPTLGFNIKTLEFLGYCRRCRLPYMGSGLIALFFAQIQAKYLGRRRADDPQGVRTQRRPARSFCPLSEPRFLRSYWRNYFEATDGLIWVVDSADTRRLVR